MFHSNISILILAAGASRRMGRPKQLLLINKHQTLIEHTIEAARAAAGKNVLVVLGANAAIIKKAIISQPIDIIENEEWEMGMGSSLKTGLEYLLAKKNNLDAVIISVCDQPYLNATVFQQLITKHHSTNAKIICSRYEGKLGVPALFNREIFSKLLALQGDEGARKIIRHNQHLVESIDFPKGIIDLDTPTDHLSYFDGL